MPTARETAGKYGKAYEIAANEPLILAQALVIHRKWPRRLNCVDWRRIKIKRPDQGRRFIRILVKIAEQLIGNERIVRSSWHRLGERVAPCLGAEIEAELA